MMLAALLQQADGVGGAAKPPPHASPELCTPSSASRTHQRFTKPSSKSSHLVWFTKLSQGRNTKPGDAAGFDGRGLVDQEFDQR